MPAAASTTVGNLGKERIPDRKGRRDASWFGHLDIGLGRDGRKRVLQESPLPHFGKDEEVEKVHEAQDQQDPADLGAQRFQHTLQVCGLVIRLEGQRDESKVNQVKADKEQVIDRIGEGLVAEEAIDEKNASVLMQRL